MPFDSEPIMDAIGSIIKEKGASLVKSFGGVVTFHLKNNVGEEQEWTIDLKNGTGEVYKGTAKTKADVTFKLSDADYAGMAMGKKNAQQLFMGGKLKLTGNMGLAMKFGNVLKAATPSLAKL
eukprot:gb/GEZN01024168.1/.p1 GENE.gb/GEZN01024168.1/~~gb/GEZN01024168.1/.p1  ORF type:complete len:122 (-),score=26.64 gb/GEZN01024168.1/:162-527(-)